MIERHRTDIAATLNEAENLDVVSGALEAFRSPRLARPRHFGFVRFDGLAGAAQRASVSRRCHRQPNPVGQVPRGFHAALEHPLHLASGDAFLGAAH
jgi:hypothetical protein